MAAMFCDIDGTTMYWGTNTFVPGAYDRLRAFYDAGNQLVFTTQRGRLSEGFAPVEPFLKQLFSGCTVLFDITSPRILINDAGAIAINHDRDAAWNYDFNV